MGVLRVLGIIILALLLISLIRIGGTAEYGEAGILVRARLGFIRFTVYPRKKKAKKKPAKEKKPEREQSGPGEAPPSKPGGLFSTVKEFLPLVADAAGQFKRKIRVDSLCLDFTAAAPDPVAAAMAFGGANAALGMIWPIFENNFNIQDRRIRTEVDFNRREPVIYVFASFSLTIGQAVVLGIRLCARFLKVLSHLKTRQKKQKEAV